MIQNVWLIPAFPLAAFSMSSTHMRMTTALRRTRTPAHPVKNSTADTAM